jgi:hypothetical protein
MKPVHDKMPKESFVPGSKYHVAMKGTPLYEAEVLKFHGGCWATVRVSKVADGEKAKYYQPGMEFDIKVAEYEIVPSS